MWKIIPGVIFCCILILVSYAEDDVEGAKTCGQNSTRPSDGFHLSFVNLTDGMCRWFIEPNVTGAKINLFLNSLLLHENDVVTIYKSVSDLENGSSIIQPLHRTNNLVTIMTEEKMLIIQLKGTDKTFIRRFAGTFQAQHCSYTIPPDTEMIMSPLVVNFTSSSASCDYHYNPDPKHRTTPSFFFEEFNFTSSTVTLSDTSYTGPYTHNPPVDFFPIGKQAKITVDIKLPSTEYFVLGMHMVDKECSRYEEIESTDDVVVIKSPKEEFNNGSIVSECRWIFQHKDTSKILGVKLNQLDFKDPYDIMAINDGGSIISPPLLQVTTSYKNDSHNQVIRSTSSQLWIGFKPKSYASTVSANVTIHGQGGYHKGNGTIKVNPTTGNDTVFLLEVEEGKVVLLNFSKSDFQYPATLSIYDGFDTTNLLATLHGNVWYPVISKSSKMMVVATSFSKGSLEATFTGTSEGCLHMATFSNENYVLSGNCNKTCFWIIPPQDHEGYDLLLNLQYLSLKKEDHLIIYQLDSARSVLGEISFDSKFVPQLSIPAKVGALVQVTQGSCSAKTEDVVLVGHSSYLPACGRDLNPSPGTQVVITSPLYPDTYPVFASCRWKVAIAKDNLVHLAFRSMQLAPNHCVRITSSDNKTEVYKGSDLKEDLLLMGETVVEFNSSSCQPGKMEQTLVSSDGFVLNATVANCGGVISGKPSGKFTVPANKSLCVWKVSIPDTESSYISYNVNKKDDKGNYKLFVYDGSSMRDTPITNDSASEIFSRTSNLIFVYRSTNPTKPSSILEINYSTKKCNKTMLCGNKVCMHPDWLCNGVDDCGDFTDEKSCVPVPVPHDNVDSTRYSAATFWIVSLLLFVVGALLGLGVPYAHEKYKNRQYGRFGDISVIE